MSDNKPQNITDADFEQKVSKGEGIILVDFWAPWCGPCHNMAPALEEFAESNAGSIKVYKLDVDDNPKTAEKYAIKSIPTLIFFKNGESLNTHRGAASRATLQEKLKGLEEGS